MIMHILDLTILEIHEAILKGEITPFELVQESLKRAKEDNTNAFEYIYEKEAIDIVNNLNPNLINSPLYGVPFVIKDNYSTKGIPTTGSSNILNGYIPPFSATIYDKLISLGAIPIGKTTLDELGMGGTGSSGHKGKTFNPYDETHTKQVGGSSCGSASAIASGIVPLAIGSDTGDSVRKPASYAGLVGLKPTWGRVSRFGLFAFATSLDHVAYFTRSVDDSALVLNLLSGYDKKDLSSSKEEVPDFLKEYPKVNGKKIAIIDEIFDSWNNKTIVNQYNKVIDTLVSDGYEVSHVSMDLDLCKAIYPTYFIISSAEANSNCAAYDGLKYGQPGKGNSFEKMIIDARTKGFSSSTKRRFIIGSYSLLKENQNEVFLRAQKCRRLIVNAVNNILSQYDAIILPASPTTAPNFLKTTTKKFTSDEIIAENYLAIGNFSGLPSITVPLGFEDNMPFGINIMCRKYEENMLFNFAKKIENITGLMGISTKRKAK